MNKITIHNFDAIYIRNKFLKIPQYTDTPLKQITHNLIRFFEEHSVNYKFGSLFVFNEYQIHYGIVPHFKKHTLYKNCFFNFVPHFIGINNNTFQDSNNGYDESKAKYLMLSIGSWNHRFRTYFPTIKNRFLELNVDLNFDIVPVFKTNKGSLTIFIQNYDENEYWFGWNKNDFDDWLQFHKNTIHAVHAHTTKNIFIKFHPKTNDTYIKLFKTFMKNTYHLTYFDKSFPLIHIRYQSDSVVINSGSAAIHMCILGTPIFYYDDKYSNIPLSYFAQADISKIDSFEISDLPDQQHALDFIASQVFSVHSYQTKCFEHFNKNLNVF